MGWWCNRLGHDRRSRRIERPKKELLAEFLQCERCKAWFQHSYALPEWRPDDPEEPDDPPEKVPPRKMTADFLKANCRDGGYEFTGHWPMLTVREQMERIGWHQERGYNTVVIAAANSRGRDNSTTWPTYDFFEEPEVLTPHLERYRRAGLSICLALMTKTHEGLRDMSRERRWDEFKRGLDVWEPLLSSVFPSIESDLCDTKADLQWMISRFAKRYPDLPRGVHFHPAMMEVEHGGWGYAYLKAMRDVDILFHQQVAYKAYPDGTRERRGPANVAHNVRIVAGRCEDDGRLFVGFENTPDKEATEAFAWELANASNKVLRDMGLPVVFGNGAAKKWTR